LTEYGDHQRARALGSALQEAEAALDLLSDDPPSIGERAARILSAAMLRSLDSRLYSLAWFVRQQAKNMPPMPSEPDEQPETQPAKQQPTDDFPSVPGLCREQNAHESASSGSAPKERAPHWYDRPMTGGWQLADRLKEKFRRAKVDPVNGRGADWLKHYAVGC
jgi:hypothetical protein